MEDIQILTIFLNYGIPSGIAIYLVWWITKSINGKLDRLISSIDKLSDRIDKLIYVIEVRDR